MKKCCPNDVVTKTMLRNMIENFLAGCILVILGLGFISWVGYAVFSNGQSFGYTKGWNEGGDYWSKYVCDALAKEEYQRNWCRLIQSK